MTEAHLECKEPTSEVMEFEAGPQGTCRSENWQSAEKAAQGPVPGCRSPPKAKGTEPRRLWIPEEVGSCLQERVLPCKSGVAQEEHHQEQVNQGQMWASNPESTAAPWRRKGNKGSRRQAAATPEEEECPAIGIGGWSSGQLSHLGRGGPTYKTHKKILELEFVKQASGMPSGL
jgi:hypothetical protein